ncbi:MAG TPA: hypothetical protein VN665_01100 [Candidatus Paceibacterota bacterium]|nr:hypothetical protein [Candidatus Paceibacterota bacterium]
MKNKLIYIIGSSLITGSLIFGGTAYAAENTRPAIFGQVAAISGREITVTGKSGKQGTTTTYTVDASKAKITEGLGQGATTVDLSNVAVGDRVAVLGQITGDAVVASSVFDKGTMKSSKNSGKK